VQKGDNSLQRLFSIFPNGWPGAGLLVLRIASGAYLLTNGITRIAASGASSFGSLAFASTIPGGLLFIGLWTPVAGILAALLEALMTLKTIEEPKEGILLLCVCTAIAMLGPGCWSIDSVLFGRRRLDVNHE
jgi:putative oxidoreductase